MIEKGKPAILCIDDEQIVLNILNHQLRKKFGDAYHYEFAESAEEGLELIEEMEAEGHVLVLVVSDQIMPGMTGDEFLVQIHENRPKPVKVLLTGQAAIDAAINAINHADLFRYLTKPWEEEDFLLTVERGVQQYFLYDELRDKNEELKKTTDVFRRFVPDQLQDRIAKEGLANIEIGGAEEGKATVLFSDIRSFASVAEKLTPTQTLDFLNEMMTPLIPVIHQQQGFINQFVGDSIMAIFYDQQQYAADRALTAAIKMHKTLKARGKQNLEEGPAINMGIGLNAGNIITGTIGNESRMEAAVIGDTVNLASRMESLTKFYHQNILATGQVVAELAQPEDYKLRLIDYVRVAGKDFAVKIFECFDTDPDEVIAQKEKMLPTFAEGLDYYRNQAWGQAIKAFQECHAICPSDKVSTIYQERCKEFNLHHPSPEWDGITKISKSFSPT